MTTILLWCAIAATTVPVYGADATFVAALAERLGKAHVPVAATWPAPAFSAPPALAAGIEAYGELRFEDAVPALTRAVAALRTRPRSRAWWGAFIDAELYLALTYGSLGRDEEADRVLDELAVFVSDPSVADGRFPPPFRDRVAKRLAQRPVKRGSIRVESDPPGAAVFVNGLRAGTTPLIVGDLAEATHTVTVVREGSDAVDRQVPVRAGFGIGAEATPELVRVTLPQTAAAAALRARTILADETQPNFAAGTPAFVILHHVGDTVLVGAFVPGRGWRRAAPRPRDVLEITPRRDQLAREVAEWFAPPPSAPAVVESAPTRWWLWTTVGAVVAGGAVAAAVAAQPDPEPARRSGGVVLGW